MSGERESEREEKTGLVCMYTANMPDPPPPPVPSVISPCVLPLSQRDQLGLPSWPGYGRLSRTVSSLYQKHLGLWRRGIQRVLHGGPPAAGLVRPGLDQLIPVIVIRSSDNIIIRGGPIREGIVILLFVVLS